MAKKAIKESVQRALILSAAMRLAKKKEFINVTREEIAAAAKCAPSLISYYFSRVGAPRRGQRGSAKPLQPDLYDAMMTEAVRVKDLGLIARGLATGNKIAESAPQSLRRDALATLL
jgi:AcrR family transcriptional regulator